MQSKGNGYNHRASLLTNENNQRSSNNFRNSNNGGNPNINLQNSTQLTNYHEKMRALGRVKYINQLAQL